MVNRKLQIANRSPLAPDRRVESVGTAGLAGGANMPNKANSQGQDCRVASLLAMTGTHVPPITPNKPNFRVFGRKMGVAMRNKANLCGRDARNWGFRIWDWGFEAADARNVKRTQFGVGENAPRRHGEHGGVCKCTHVKELGVMLCVLWGSVVSKGPGAIGDSGLAAQHGMANKANWAGRTLARLPRRFASRNDTNKRRPRRVKRTQFQDGQARNADRRGIGGAGARRPPGSLDGGAGWDYGAPQKRRNVWRVI